MKALIFDMDGVLFDTEAYYFDRRNHFFSQNGIATDHLRVEDFIGGRLEQLWPMILGSKIDHYDLKGLEADYISYKERVRAPYADLMFPDVKPLLDSLQEMGILMAVASNGEKSDILYALEEAGLDAYFTCVFSGSEFPKGKPDPAIYLAAQKALGVEKADTLIIEDSPTGIQAGKAAGMRVCARRDRTYGSDQSAADDLVDDLTEVKEIILSSR